jgi:hypothetical protein
MILRNPETGELTKLYQQQNAMGGRYYYLVDARGQITATRSDAMFAASKGPLLPDENYTHDSLAQMWFYVVTTH